jgi:hypothetical protein
VLPACFRIIASGCGQLPEWAGAAIAIVNVNWKAKGFAYAEPMLL